VLHGRKKLLDHCCSQAGRDFRLRIDHVPSRFLVPTAGSSAHVGRFSPNGVSSFAFDFRFVPEINANHPD
jgi:hypothetical protein